MYSLIIKNANVIDGTGKPAEVMDVAVQGEKIVAVDKNIKTSAQTEVEGRGLCLAPGFVDLQNHSDSYWQLFDNPSLSSLLTQGYTTILVGNCGASIAPILNHDSLLSIQKWHNLEAANINWQYFSEFIGELSKMKLGCNVGSLIGYSTLRRAIVGDQVRGLDARESKALAKILVESLEAGAFGLSTGLSYAHEIIISELELFELAKIVASKEALLSMHLRNEGLEIVEALDEALEIGRHTGANLKISHLKVRNDSNFAKLPEVLNLLESAYLQGINVQFDAYPYDTVWQALYSYLPKWAMEGGRQIMLKHFADPVQKNKILVHLNNSNVKFSSMTVASTANHLNFTGKSIGQIAKNLEASSEQAVLHLIANGGSEVLVFEKSLNEEQVHQLLLHPLGFIGTDGAGFSLTERGRLVHPRCFGTAPRFLKMVLDKKELTLEEGIAKLTSKPAKKAGIEKRGEIKVGNFADLVLFNPQKITDKSTYENPFQYSTGISHVFVNGKPAVENGQLTAQLSGRALRKS